MAQGAVHPGESTPATAATRRTGLASPDPARGRLPVTPRELGFTPFRDPPPPPAPQEGAMPNSPEGIRGPGWIFSKPVPENEDLTTPGSSLDSTREALAREELLTEEQDAQLDAQTLVSADLSQGKPPAKAAIHPVRDPSSQEGAPPNSLDEIQTPEWKPCVGSQAVPDTEDVRTPVSSLKSTCEALAHEAFTDEQHAQLYAHILITADLNQGKPPSKAAMVLAFGQPVEGEKHAWEEVWRAALDRYQSQMSPMGWETPFSSQNGPLEPSPNSMKNLEEFELKETHSELVDTQSSKRQNQKSPMTGFETPINSVIGNCTAQGLDVQNGGEQLAVSCAHKVDQELPDDSKDLIKNLQTLLEPLSCSTPLESSESLTEQDSCVKCGKDGQLLKCRSCFLGAHANCLGSSVRFDETGHFDCPVCFCRKAAKALEKAKKTYSEARKNLSVFCSGWKQFTNEHIEQSTGKQQRAANFEDQMNGCRTAKKQGDHQSEAAELSRKGEEPSHLKGNGTSDASPEKVATTKTDLCPISENAKSHGDGNSSLSRVVPYSPWDRFSSVANRNIGVGKENSFMNSPHCNFSDRLGAISTRNTSRCRVTFQEVGTVAPNSSWKTLKYQDQSVHSPARKRYYPYPPEYYYSPCTPAMRSPLVPSKTPFTSTTARRKMIFWTEAEEAALMEAVAKFAPKGEAANEKRAISWVRIHEYGKESFHPTRCPDDLRKKWNRMKNKLGCPETCPAPLGVVLGEREGK